MVNYEINYKLLDNNLNYKYCPLCLNKDIKNKGEIKYPEKLLFSSVYVKLKNKSELWYCNNCLSGFIQNVIRKEDAEMLYTNSDSTKRWQLKGNFIEDKTKDVISIMKRLLYKANSIIDIGCNTGELLDYAKRCNCITYGIEYSESGEKICKGKGHNMLKSLKDIVHPVDIIVAFDLIEHLYNFNEFLYDSFNALSPEGNLVILTGNINSLPAKLLGSHWWYNSFPEHIIFPSINLLFSLPNWVVEDYRFCYNSNSHIKPFTRILLSNLKNIVMKKYSGSPSFWPDHYIIILTRKKDHSITLMNKIY